MIIFQTTSFVFFIVKCINGNVAQLPNSQLRLFEDVLNNMKQVYDDRLEDMQKRLKLQEEDNNELRRQYSTLAGILQGVSRERRLLDTLVPQTTTPTPVKPKVAFYAQLTHDKASLGDYQVIEFDLVTTNIGNAYNNVDGLFTAPVPGTYVFLGRLPITIELITVVNGNMIGKTLSDSADHDDITVASNTVAVNLQAGDVVCIRSMTGHTHTLMGAQMSTFTGFLLYSN